MAKAVSRVKFQGVEKFFKSRPKIPKMPRARVPGPPRYRGDMPATPEFRQPYRQQARQWSRMAWAMAALFASMPAASKLFLGVWGFDGAAEIACLCLMLGTYFHLMGRRRSRAVPDPASMLDQARQLTLSGQMDEAIALLTETIRLSPQLWQAFQYRGELYLRQQSFDAALRDLDEAIRLAPEEPHLHILRAQAQSLLGEGQP